MPDLEACSDKQKQVLEKVTSMGEGCLEPFITDPTKPTLIGLLKEYMVLTSDQP